MFKKYSIKDRTVLFFSLESRDTGLSANVYLNKGVKKLTVLLDCKKSVLNS